MNTVNVIVSGLGGQGILFMTKVLAQTALKNGDNVLGAETHGMAQRGGSVVSHLKIGDARSSLINAGAAHYLLALEENEAYRNLPFLAPAATLVVNTDKAQFPSEKIQAYLSRQSIDCRTVPATRLAVEAGAPRSANLALIGFAAAFDDTPLAAADLRRTVDRISPDRFKAVNLTVFDAGLKWGQTLGASG